MKLSLLEARRLQLQSQGLRSPSQFSLGKEGVLQALRRLSYVQIDTISVVQRAHHHVLWSRVPDYKPSWLHELQSADKQVLEYWSHAAAYLPIESYRYCLPRMMKYRRSDEHWWKKDKKVMKVVFDRIRRDGPLRARDFENTTGRKAGPWFDRTPSKKALEHLFHEGRLVISERQGFQKVYELPERYLPSDIDKSVPTQAEYSRHLITSALAANGLVTAREIAYLRKGVLALVEKELGKMVKEKLLKPVTVDGSSSEYYAFADCKVPHNQTPLIAHILSPFDNLVIQRARLKTFFDFDYQIECYVPAAKRKFGYFVLPVLLGDDFVARIDAKADRATQTFIVKALHYEKAFNKKRKLISKPLNEEIERFAQFNGCTRIVYE